MKKRTIIGLVCGAIVIGVTTFVASNMFLKSKSNDANQAKEKTVATANDNDKEKSKLEEENKKLQEEKAKLEQEKQKAENEKLKQENEKLKKEKENVNTTSTSEGNIKINNSKESYLRMANFANGVYVEGANAWAMMNIDGVWTCMSSLRNVAETYSGGDNLTGSAVPLAKTITKEGAPKASINAFLSLISELKRLKFALAPLPSDNANTATIRRIEHIKTSVDNLAKEILAICEQHGVRPNCG